MAVNGRMPDGKVMIIGAGVGGLTAAIALARRDREVVIFERADRFLEVGAGIALTSNAITALREIGLDRQIADRGAVIEYFAHRTSQGKLLRTWPIGKVAEKVGAPIVGIGRPDVQRVLAGALGSTEVRFDHEFVGLEQDDGGVTARFANGEAERGSVLVGADGSQSTVRALFDRTPRRYIGYTSWVALVDVESPAGTQTQWYGRGPMFGAHSVGPGKSYWYATDAAPPGGRDADAKGAVLELFGDWHAPVRELVEVADAIGRIDVYDLPRRESWGKGRVTLLGDAAHPMSPAMAQGASQAIEDGVILARTLTSESDPVAAVRAYEARRIERTAPIVKRARMQGKMMHGDNVVTSVARASSLRFAPTAAVLKSFEKLMTFER